MEFTKASLSIEDQINLCIKRGLSVPDRSEMEHYLRHIGYYRLSGYALPFTRKHEFRPPLTPEQGHLSHHFKSGTTFEDIISIYRFDRELRLLMLDAIERVEVAFRTCVSNHLCWKHGCHWYFNVDCFPSGDDRKAFAHKVMEETGFEPKTGTTNTRGKDVFIRHYYQTYTEPKLPPSWMIAEVLSVSTWSHVYSGLKRELQKQIANNFALSPEILGSWMHAVSYTRNICAHHGRLWNREFTIRPRLSNAVKDCFTDNSRFYAQAFVLNHLLKIASPSTSWWDRLSRLLQEHPKVDPVALGMPTVKT